MIPKSENDVTKWLNELEKHPLSMKMREDMAEAELAKRKDAAAKIEALEKERDEVIPKLRAALDEKGTKLKELQAALNNTAAELSTAKYALSTESHGFEMAIKNCQNILIESASPLIDAAITFFDEKLTWLRKPGRISRRAAGSEKNVLTWKKKTRQESNAPAVKAALNYCQAAIKELEKMKLSASPDLQKIEDLKKGIPPIDVFTEYQGEKTLPEINTDPFAGIPTDSEHNWRIGTLNEKLKKLMRR